MATAAADRPGDACRCAPRRRTWKARRRCGSERPRASSSRPRQSIRAAGLGGGDVPGAAPRHLHQPGQDQARATAAASTSCARRSCGAPLPPSAPAGYTYPAAELKRLWRLVLLQQFHDILPGSSIAWVHQDAERNYAGHRGARSAHQRRRRGPAWGGDTEFLLNASPASRRESRRSRRPVPPAAQDAARCRFRATLLTAATSWTTASSVPCWMTTGC
jgi:hypothetical protein